MRWLSESEIYMLPYESKETWEGLDRPANVAWPPSPPNVPLLDVPIPVPATVEMIKAPARTKGRAKR